MALSKSDIASAQQVAVSGLNLDSFASDKISEVAGLKDLNANLDGEATIQAASTAKSTAVANGVTDKVASLAEIASNAGLTSSVPVTGVGPKTVVLAGDGTYTASSYTPTSAANNITGGYTAVGGDDNLSVGDKVAVSGQNYFVANVGFAGANTFQVANSYENALAGVPLTTNLPTVSGQVFYNSHNLSVGDAVTVGGSTFYVESTPTSGTFKLAASLGGAALTGADAPAAWSNSGATFQRGGINDIDVSSNSTINNSSASTVSATASTTNGAAASVADLGHAAGIENLLDLDVGGNLTMQGKSSAGISSSSETVTGEAGATSTLSGSQVGIETTGLADIKADASIQGIAQLTNTAKAATFNSSTNLLDNVLGAEASASAGNIQGASLEDLTIGGIGNVIGQVSLANNAEASNVAGAATAAALQGGGAAGTTGLFEGLDLQGPLNVKSDATLDGISNLTAKAVANTTAGAATADAEANLLRGADLTGGTVDVGGTATIKGNLNYGLTALAGNVDSGNVSADAQANSGVGFAGKGSTNVNPQVESIGIDIASDATLSGLNIGSLRATSTSTAGNATATAGDGDKATGAQLPSLDIGGVGTITAGAQLDSAAVAESVGGISTAEAGKSGVVVGLNADGQSSGETFRTAITDTFGAKDFSSSVAATGITSGNDLLDNFNINVASDASITAQAFSNLDATATSTAGKAVATGGLASTVTGIDAGMDIKVGGIGNLTALAQGTTDTTATSVSDDAEAQGTLTATGFKELEMQTLSDATLKSTAGLVGNATANTTGDNAAADNAYAGLDLTSRAVDGLAIAAGGIGNLTGAGSVNGTVTADSVTANSDARAGLDATGIDNAWFKSLSDGNINGSGLLTADITSTTTAGNAIAEGDFDATGASKLYVGNTEFTGGTSDDFKGIGGIANIKGQAQVTADMDVTSVTGSATAYSGFEDPASSDPGVLQVNANASTIRGLFDVDINGASDGTILGTAKGTFTTTASTTGNDGSDNAIAKSAQSLFGINDLNLNLGGMGQINAIVNDTNFTDAHSVSGNATAISTIDAIGLSGGDMHIAGNASIMSTVGVDSRSESSAVA